MDQVLTAIFPSQFQDSWYRAIAATLVVSAVAPAIDVGSRVAPAHHKASRPF